MGATEVWKHVWGFSSYMVSNMGRIKSRETGLFVVQEPSKTGHMTVVLTDNQHRKFIKRVERIVIDAFDWQSGDYSQIIHIDNDRTNCRYSNLQRVYDTDSVTSLVRRNPIVESRYIGMDDEGNEVPASRTSPRAKTPKRRPLPRVKQIPVAEPTKKERVAVQKTPVTARKPPHQGVKLPVRVVGSTREYASITEMCMDLDLDISSVSKMLRGEGSQKTYKGLRFEYVEAEDKVVVQVAQSVAVKRERRLARRIRHIESGRIFESQNDAARQLNLSQSLISAVLRGIRKHHGGYDFEYVDD